MEILEYYIIHALIMTWKTLFCGMQILSIAMCHHTSSEVSSDNVTGEATTAVLVSTQSNTCSCDCDANGLIFYSVVNITEELQLKLDTLKKETKVDEENLSSTIRARTSASDPRPSSAYVGYVGIALLATTFGGILLLDLPRMIMMLKTFFL
ncbi:uncharacterized protein LOC117331064 [Pecten maximus]|uniref:uncharacterized protein LOC117331064 n=1 Tax=Pecten maximus TaxID=6579 RepID=UPI001457E8BF|nr:uncharacterized protein LOC117331064 [Pecten maximus]